jgi:AraC-like DNA-binding protein
MTATGHGKAEGQGVRISQSDLVATRLMRKRILRAKLLMLASGDSLASIALCCGLSDQSHFSHVFRRYVGASPNAWRRQYCWNQVRAS